MAKKVTFDYSKANCFITENEVKYMSKIALDAKELLVSKEGPGNDFVGWIDLPVDYDKEEFERLIDGEWYLYMDTTDGSKSDARRFNLITDEDPTMFWK